MTKDFLDQVYKFWSDRKIERLIPYGRINRELPNFYCLEVSPGLKEPLWTYVSVGNTLISPKLPELMIQSDCRMRSLTQLLSMIASVEVSYRNGIYVDKTYDIGSDIIPGSEIRFLLVSYVFGLNLDRYLSIFDSPNNFLALMPLTRREKKYFDENGLDALAERFDRSGVYYGDFLRSSVI